MPDICSFFQIKEWLCLNCQMQRALGASEPTVAPMMKTPRQIPSQTVLQEKDKQLGKHEIPVADVQIPTLTKKDDNLIPESSQIKAVVSGALLDEKCQTIDQHKQQPAVKPPSVELLNASKADSKPGPVQPELNKPLNKVPKAEVPSTKSAPAPAQPVKTETGFFGFGGAKSQPTPTKPAESVTGKMFGFGSSIFNSASTLITTPPASPKLSTVKETKPPAVQKAEQGKKPEQPQQTKAPPSPSVQAKVDKAPSDPPKAAASQAAPKPGQSTCPLCKVGLNMGSKDPPNFNTCTVCKNDVCNQCGFNPMPHSAAVSILFVWVSFGKC